MTRTSRGFTLVEIMVATVVGGMLVMLVHGTFVTMTDGLARLELQQTVHQEEHLGYRRLRTALLSLEAGGKEGEFRGEESRLAFSTWRYTVNGWLERERVEVSVQDTTLVLGTSSGVESLCHGVHAVAFDYLLEPGLESRWVSNWISPVSAPLAVRVRLDRARQTDTLLFLVRGRG